MAYDIMAEGLPQRTGMPCWLRNRESWVKEIQRIFPPNPSWLTSCVMRCRGWS